MKYKYQILVLSLFILSCTKNVAGPKGDTGTPADTGNAKQITTAVFGVKPDRWTLNGRNWEAQIYVPEITADVVTSGEVITLMQNENSWWPLPFGEGDTFTNFSFRKGYINLVRNKIHGTVDTPSFTNFRVQIYYQ